MKLDFIGYHNALYISGEEELKTYDHVLEKEEYDGLYFVSNTNIEGVFRYGFKQSKEDYFGNPVGYIWSSRAGVMNKLFDTALIEVYYKKENGCSYTSCSIDLAHLEPLLAGSGYEIVWEPAVDETDVCYAIREVVA